MISSSSNKWLHKQHTTTTVISGYMNVLPGVFCCCCCLDLETFLSDGLKGENLSKKAKERRETFIKRIKDVKLGYVSMSLCIIQNSLTKISLNIVCYWFQNVNAVESIYSLYNSFPQDFKDKSELVLLFV